MLYRTNLSSGTQFIVPRKTASVVVMHTVFEIVKSLESFIVEFC